MMISCDNSMNKLLRDTSNEMNKTCPMVIDEYTTLMNTGVINESLMYNYKINKDFFNDYDISKSQWEKNQVNQLTNFYCTDPDFKLFKDNNVNVIWKYSDWDGFPIDKIEINSNDCYN